MVQIIYLVIVLISMSKPVLTIIGLNRNMCPHTSQWSLRSTSLCNKSKPEYLCLFDDNENVYKEFCQKKSDTQRPGYEFVIRGELDDKECDKDRYQPIKLTTAGHSRCMFDKSKCSEEGQLVYDNGTIISDRLCRCDYTHSYSFVNASKNNCFCDPSTEDCSCYKMNCPDKLVLSPDYMCIELKKFPGNNNCQEIKRPQINIDVSNQEKGHFTIIIPKVLARNRKDLLILLSICFGAVSVIGLGYRYQYYLKGTRTGKYDKATRSRTEKGMESKQEEITNKLKKFESQIGDMDQSTNNTVNSPEDNINRIIRENKWETCALVLCILFYDGFNTDWLTLKITPENKKAKLQDIVNEFKIDLFSENSMFALKSAFASLNGTYLIRQRCSTEYNIINDMIYQHVFVTCGESFTKCFIKYASSSLIRDQFFFQSFKPAQLKDDLIVLSEDEEGMYFDRLFRDLRKLNVRSTFHNKQLQYPPFVDKLIRFYKKKEDAKQVLKELDINGRTVEDDDRNSRCSSATTPLIESASGGYVDIVYFLIDTVKSEVNNRDGEGRTALYKASEAGNTNVVQLLLEKNANVNQCNMYNESPLYVACKAKHCGIVDILLQNNASVSQCTISNKSPLYEACAEGGNDIVELLLKKDADVNQCDDTGKSPLYMACAHGYAYIVNVLLQKVVSQLNAAVDEGSHELVDPLLQNVVDVNHCDNDEESPLYVACVRGYTDIVEILLKTEVDVNKCNRMDDSPLNVACMAGYIDIVERLLSKAADVNLFDLEGESPLHMACTGGHKDIVEILLKENADVNQWDNDGKSPLHVACAGGYTDIVEILLKAHANINECYGEKQEFPLYVACAGGYKDIVEMLLKNGADVCQCNIEEETPLFVACAMGYTDIVELLLHRNSKASQCNKAGSFPLYVACARGRTDIVKMLLQNDPHVLLCTQPEYSPLHVVCDFDSFKHLQYGKHGKDVYEKKVKDHIAIVELLISCNVDANKMDSKQQTPLDIAKKSDCSELINILDNLS